MKLGTLVAVCHDGKWGRRVKGVVVGTRRGHHIQVQFPHPETGEPIEFWARKRPAVRHARRRRANAYVTSVTLKCKVSFAGWAETGVWGPWYAVYPWPRKVRPENTFMAAVRGGTQTLAQVDDWVEAWHNGKAGDLELREHLGLSRAQYAAWMKNPGVLAQFL